MNTENRIQTLRDRLVAEGVHVTKVGAVNEHGVARVYIEHPTGAVMVGADFYLLERTQAARYVYSGIYQDVDELAASIARAVTAEAAA